MASPRPRVLPGIARRGELFGQRPKRLSGGCTTVGVLIAAASKPIGLDRDCPEKTATFYPSIINSKAFLNSDHLNIDTIAQP